MTASPSLRPLAGAALAVLLPPLAPRPDFAALQREVVRAHAAWCHETYAECEARARALAVAVDRLLATPNETTLAAARRAWCDARVAYGRTETLRFRGGPIEPLEPFVNAWPVDEAYIDAVAGAPDSGLIHDLRGFPSLGGSLLRLANERGGEANVCLGWHAIEFVLWGQDLAIDGPGARPATDFEPGVGRNAARRSLYLRTVVALLVQDLATVRAAWEPGAAARRAFEAEPAAAVRAILTGASVLTSFELAGERLTVALETRDQEQEHSCFSDTTHVDLVANQDGIATVLRGARGGAGRGPGVLDLVRTRNAELGAALDRSLDATTAAIQAIPAPFDRAFLGDDDAAGRRAIRHAIEALERQAEVLQRVGQLLGHGVPSRPGG